MGGRRNQFAEPEGLMKRWITRRIETASWRRFFVWFVLWFAYNWWAFSMSSPWTRALAAGGGKLPEMQPGFPPIEPQRSLDALAAANATGDYLLWQALDLPYAVGNLLVTSIAIALALKAVRLEKSVLKYLLALPPLYVFCEVIENALVAAFAAKTVAPGEAAVLIQQAATTVKMFSGFGSMFLGLAALVVAAIAALVGLLRKRA
jgi:hypothetical protein